MATLHLVNHHSALNACLEVAAAEDSIVLIEDGVYSALKSSPRSLFAIEDDVQARGLASHINEDTVVIDYTRLVELVAKHQPIVSWD